MVVPAGAFSLALLLAALFGPAATSGPDVLSGPDVRTASPEEYRQSLQAAAILVQACRTSSQGCDDARVATNLLVKPDGYSVEYDWLRTAMRDARPATAAGREQSMRDAAARLNAELRSLDAPARSTRREQDAANAVLARPEFRYADAEPSWWDRQTTRFWAWFNRVLSRAANAGARRPWIGLAVEWTLLGASLAGLLGFLLRALRADRSVRELPWASQRGNEQHSATDWESLAGSAAAERQWRDAVHALYWASVTRLSVQGRWRELAPRTPREYLRLLGPDSTQRSELAELTALLERVWYAGRTAGEREYRAARGLAEKLGVPAGTPTGASHA